ncbi:MAG: hypothetical protein COV44_10595 [Deltaproteobacteria bacterium CG11_big_fil_rev_8_21_14_0_20_45_16]|uniref:Uncharacterized protein n=1 Tax=candidate division WWE3 bacterium CG_4_9_14_3_um_filter_39_7 TaxID=1975080 RepID=A0A2M7X1A4_UNCKA|nr:MAG: hypothetical protein COV44_10595 [Deltaproteobacteria bacterium CG11_big_fil_rev_8_21_14_0_20_45_16]PJA39957.1 MAG: hypothetical protein CO179_03865 [candidate division WWE3 bacterium CG_4_9_14_3_um_filter_39_7]
MNTVINLTPHAIKFQAEDGTRTVFPPSGEVARVEQYPGETTTVDFAGVEVPVQGAPEYGWVEGLPEPKEGVVFIVSGFVLNRAVGRNADVFGPGTGPQDEAIRFPDGHKLAGLVDAVTRFNAAPAY